MAAIDPPISNVLYAGAGFRNLSGGYQPHLLSHLPRHDRYLYLRLENQKYRHRVRLEEETLTVRGNFCPLFFTHRACVYPTNAGNASVSVREKRTLSCDPFDVPLLDTKSADHTVGYYHHPFNTHFSSSSRKKPNGDLTMHPTPPPPSSSRPINDNNETI